MQTDHLRTFIWVVRTGSFSRAAGDLHYSQSTVTAHIQALEREIGVRLFDRCRDGVRPTFAGDRMYCYARGIFALLEDARSAIAQPSHASTGQVQSSDSSMAGALTPRKEATNDSPAVGGSKTNAQRKEVER
jgi:DNA-binding transcriptional LysR family regulator